MAEILPVLTAAAADLAADASAVATRLALAADEVSRVAVSGRGRAAFEILEEGLQEAGELARTMLREAREGLRKWDEASSREETRKWDEASSREEERHAATLMAAAEGACGAGKDASGDGLLSGGLEGTGRPPRERRWEIHLTPNERIFSQDKFIQTHGGVCFVVELPPIIQFADRERVSKAHTTKVRCASRLPLLASMMRVRDGGGGWIMIKVAARDKADCVHKLTAMCYVCRQVELDLSVQPFIGTIGGKVRVRCDGHAGRWGYDVPVGAEALKALQALLAHDTACVHLVEPMGACGYVCIAAAAAYLAGWEAKDADIVVPSLIHVLTTEAGRFKPAATRKDYHTALWRAAAKSRVDGYELLETPGNMKWVDSVKTTLLRVGHAGSAWSAHSTAWMTDRILGLCGALTRVGEPPIAGALGLVKRIFVVFQRPRPGNTQAAADVFEVMGNSTLQMRRVLPVPQAGDVVLVGSNATNHFCAVTCGAPLTPKLPRPERVPKAGAR